MVASVIVVHDSGSCSRSIKKYLEVRSLCNSELALCRLPPKLTLMLRSVASTMEFQGVPNCKEIWPLSLSPAQYNIWILCGNLKPLLLIWSHLELWKYKICHIWFLPRLMLNTSHCFPETSASAQLSSPWDHRKIGLIPRTSYHNTSSTHEYC